MVKLRYKKIIIFNDSFKDFHKLDPFTLKSIKQIEFWINLDKSKIEIIKSILHQIEWLKIPWQSNLEFYGSFLRFCPNLKFLFMWIKHRDKKEIDECKWLLQHYPKLEHFVFDDGDAGGPEHGWTFSELRIFFEMNPNIRRFSTTFHLLYENRNIILNSKIQFDQLDIQGRVQRPIVQDVCVLLNKLHEKNVHKHLRVYALFATTQSLQSSLHALNALFLVQTRHITLPPMPKLKILGFNHSSVITLPNNLMDIERIYMEKATFNEVLQFIRYAPRVTHIKIYSLNDGTYFNNKVLDLEALNEDRKVLQGARKITIYVDEEIFLATKWTYQTTKIQNIEIKRSQSTEWESLCLMSSG
ncbi:uncharacterized protein LOC116351014 [Contarinia nasturtii]|uniref:uncharacterized protein LOC116351014 n=1 Tax=Contarinia nasturtii TaxID=265458 RepID=UPI0012D4BECC|nr:uncharacterized protein LOC116351014 [Contarinia nasturtii]